MVRHTILPAAVLGLLLGTLASVCPDDPSEETALEPTATAEAVIDANETAGEHAGRGATEDEGNGTGPG